MFKKILIPLDGSDLAAKALSYAEALGGQFDAELILLWVLHPQVVLSGSGGHSFETVINLEQQEARLYLAARQIELTKKGLKNRIEILDGLVAEQIIAQTRRERADLIVMSTHGRSGLKRWVLGSVAAKVLQDASCPVLLIRLGGQNNCNLTDPSSPYQERKVKNSDQNSLPPSRRRRQAQKSEEEVNGLQPSHATSQFESAATWWGTMARIDVPAPGVALISSRP